MRTSDAKPSISLSRAIRVFSRSDSPPWLAPSPRVRPTASISSMKMIAPPRLLRAVEEVAGPLGADTGEGLDEVGPGEGEERQLGLAGDGAGQEGLAGPGRPDQKAAARCLRAQGEEAVGSLEELHQLAEVVDGLVATRHVREAVVGDLAELLAALAGEPPDASGEDAGSGEPDQQPDDDEEGEQGEQHAAHDRGRLGRSGLDQDIVLEEELRQAVGVRVRVVRRHHAPVVVSDGDGVVALVQPRPGDVALLDGGDDRRQRRDLGLRRIRRTEEERAPEAPEDDDEGDDLAGVRSVSLERLGAAALGRPAHPRHLIRAIHPAFSVTGVRVIPTTGEGEPLRCKAPRWLPRRCRWTYCREHRKLEPRRHEATG